MGTEATVLCKQNSLILFLYPFLFFFLFFSFFFSFFLFPVLAAGSDAKVDGRWRPLKCGYDNMLWALGYRSHVHQKGPLNNA